VLERHRLLREVLFAALQLQARSLLKDDTEETRKQAASFVDAANVVLDML